MVLYFGYFQFLRMQVLKFQEDRLVVEVRLYQQRGGFDSSEPMIGGIFADRTLTMSRLLHHSNKGLMHLYGTWHCGAS